MNDLDFRFLLAKKPLDYQNIKSQEMLTGHTKNVVSSAEAIFGILKEKITLNFKLSQDEQNQLYNAYLAASWLHDLGKANDHFQRMLREPSFKQGIRHEKLSYIMLYELDNWLDSLWSKYPTWFKAACFFSISGHHLKFPDPIEKKRIGTKVKVLWQHSDLSDVLKLGSNLFSLGEPPPIKTKEYSLTRRGEIVKLTRKIQRELYIDFSDREKLFIAIVKSLLLTSDLAGSALPRRDISPKTWISRKLNKVLREEHLEKIVKTKLSGKKLRDFQIEVKNAINKTILVEAGCGTGKTAAAYLWAAQNAKGKRLFFCYPTTGTASEGFSGYMHDPDFDSVLIHSRAKIDYKLLNNMPNPNHEENELRKAKLEALEVWPIQAVVCTAHTVLGMLENVRRGLYAFPCLVQSVFVFDEVHAFSNKLFSYLLRFLKEFKNVPVLLMTASLPPGRKKAIEDLSNYRGAVTVIKGPKVREEALRYKIIKTDEISAWEESKKILASGGKVLWINNTVNRLYFRLEKAITDNVPVQPYHSRYRYKDRLKRQRALIDGFKAEKPAMLGLTTQVAEMSLDISADLLVSEWAPIPALIQRLGRLNRYEMKPKNTKKALFIKPENFAPYFFGNKEEQEKAFEEVEKWINKLSAKDAVSQRDVINAFLENYRAEESIKPAPRCEWIDGLWETQKNKRSIEEASYCIDLIMEEDSQEPFPAENAIPMPFPRNDDWKKWKNIGRYLIAPKGRIKYDEFKGAQYE